MNFLHNFLRDPFFKRGGMRRTKRAQQDFITLDADNRRAVLNGEWTVFRAGALERAVESALPALGGLAIDAARIERLDTAGAWQLRRVLEAGKAGAPLTDRQQALLKILPASFERPPKKRGMPFLFEVMIAFGMRVEETISFLYDLLCFIGQIFIRFVINFRHPRHFRLPAIVRHINETGIRALPIISLLAILMSMVIAYQASIQLNKFGASVFTIDLTVISLLREMGVLITAIMVAGRSGSAFAAEIGVMKLREEVDALKTIGLDPIEILVLPRVIALMIALPLLTFAADIMGLTGGALMSITVLDVPLSQFMQRAENVGTPLMFFVGMIKAPVFAFLIAVIGTYQGMNVSGSAESVGKLTTVAVVQSIFAVITADALFSIIFSQMGL
jgi:phospholipid/cholesterol/gamma-HCH transport system permease protein